jgi:hypothetical protein
MCYVIARAAGYAIVDECPGAAAPVLVCAAASPA